MLKPFVNEGRLTLLGAVGLVLIGFGLVYLSLEFFPTKWLKLFGLAVGLGVAAVGGFSGRASALGLPPPFTNDPLGWRKAKQSYKAEPGEQGQAEPKDASAPKRDES